MVFTRDAEGRLVPLRVTPAVQPVQQGISSSSGMAQVSSAENPVDTSVPPGGQVNLKSSSMSPQQQQQQQAQPVQKTPAPAKKATIRTPVQKSQEQQVTPPATQQEEFKGFTKSEPVQAPLETQDTPEQQVALHELAQGTAATTGAPIGKRYQTVFNWLRRKDPTLTPWTDFVLHGPRTSIAKSNASDMEAAQFEQQVLRNQMAQGQDNMTMAQVRLRQQYQNQWNNLVNDWNKGYYSGDEQTEQAFYDEAKRLLGAMNAVGMNTSVLRMPSINAGGFSQGYNKTLAEPLENLRHLDSVMGEIYSKAANDPNWLTGAEATTYFDKLGEYAILDLAKSKGQIADAEKVRIQVEMMDPNIRKMYDNIMMKFFADNRSLMAVASQYNLDLSARKSLEDLRKDLNGEGLGVNQAPKGADIGWNSHFMKTFTKGTQEHANVVNAIADVFNGIERAGGNVPTNLQAMFSALKNGMDEFHDYVLQDAPVNMPLVWNMASRMRNESLSKYNDWARKNGKFFGWKYRSAYNVPEQFGRELEQFQNSKLFQDAQAPVYRKNITAGAHIPPKGDIQGKIPLRKISNGGGTR